MKPTRGNNSPTSSYANAVGELRLVQPCDITAVELSWENNAFRGRFREVTLVPTAETSSFTDVREVNPREQRAAARDRLLDETDYNPENNEEEPAYWPQLANYETQRLHRYRLVTVCNFLTNLEIMEMARQPLAAILLDLQPGAIVVVIGGTSGHYPELYERFDQLVESCGLRRRMAGVRVSSEPDDTQIALTAARTIAQHVQRLAPMTDEVPRLLSTALERGDNWGGVSAVRVYRRNRYGV